MKRAYVNLFEFSLGVGIDIGDERYNLVNANADGILQMIRNYDVDELVLVGPKIITNKYERDLKQLTLKDYGFDKLNIICMEDK